ncbi:MAG: hypothetical protein QOJ95_5342, partial [Mycobacterium sp.]|nr:hypothetical protein [Mycobacterium sp.]
RHAHLPRDVALGVGPATFPRNGELVLLAEPDEVAPDDLLEAVEFVGGPFAAVRRPRCETSCLPYRSGRSVATTASVDVFVVMSFLLSLRF